MDRMTQLSIDMDEQERIVNHSSANTLPKITMIATPSSDATMFNEGWWSNGERSHLLL